MRIITVRNVILSLLALVICAAPNVFAQRRQQQPRPARTAAAAPKPAATDTERGAAEEERAAEKRIITVTLKEGAPVTGEYLNAGANSLFLVVAGNRISIKLDDVKAVYFAGAPAADAATPASEPAAAPQTGTLSIEAGIIYKMGGNQPVSRTEFMLLDQSLETILNEAGIPARDTGVLSSYAFAMLYPSQFPGVGERAQAAIKQHAVQTVSTDFSGKAQFTDIKPGSYFIMGLSSTRKGFAIWNLPVEVKAGQNSVFLDQNNAASAF